MARRQLTAFLPSPVREQVAAIRDRWDPEMARRIAPHITLVYDANGIAAVPNAPITVRLTEARCWSTPESGIYLGVDDVDGDIDALRRALGIDAADYVPHVTLVHPRAASAPVEAWTQLEGWTVDERISIDRTAIIEFNGSTWSPL